MVSDEDLDYLESIERELEESNKSNRKLNNAQLSLFGTPNDDNLVRWQLDLKEDLDKIHHLLKGDRFERDEKGNEFYVEPEDDNLKPFNEFGVQLIMNIISFYLNRNTLLSNYDEETINYKVYDFGYEMTDLIFNRYEDMMMTTSFEREFSKLYNLDLYSDDRGNMYYMENEEYHKITEDMVNNVKASIEEHLIGKTKMYPMIIRELVDSVHSAYLRALNGGERSSLRTVMNVQQRENLGAMQQYPIVSQPKKRSRLNPFNWF